MPKPSRPRRTRTPGRTPRRRLHVEPLEDRRLLSDFKMIPVTNTANSGTGSLYAAICQVNSDTNDKSANPDQIDFNIPTSDPGYDAEKGGWTITPAVALPPITNPVFIDGTTQPGYPSSIIIIDCNDASGVGLQLAGKSGGSTIRGLEITLSSGAGISITTNNNVLEANFLYFDEIGVQINVGTMGNTIGATTAAGGNTITFSSQDGIQIASGGSAMTVVEGNTIAENFGNGVDFEGGSNDTIGGTVAGAGNAIYGNEQDGILLTGFTSANSVEGNFIGTTDGIHSFPNSGNGIEIDLSASNTIGGTTTAERNVISGNGQDGVLIKSSLGGAGAQNVVEGNLIGIDVSGQKVVLNGGFGVDLLSGYNDSVGGSVAGSGNVISGNLGGGIRIAVGYENLVQGNTIGGTTTGTINLGNIGNGIAVVNGSSDDTIGGAASTAGNIIIGNSGAGVLISASTGDNMVLANDISGNGGDGIGISGGSGPNTIGGDVGNIISDNSANGVLISASTGSTFVVRNSISGNGDNGIWISGGSGSSTIGGAVGNAINGNLGDGVLIGSNSGKNLVQGNAIINNTTNGVELTDAGATTIGGTTTVVANTVTGSNDDEVLIRGSDSNLVEGNSLSGGDVNGVEIDGGSECNTIGGTTPAAGNTISDQGQDGVRIASFITMCNLVEGNQIFDNAEGVELINTQENTVGGTTAGARNIISGNTGSGIRIATGSTSNQVLGNFIGTNSSGQVAWPNGVDGVDLDQTMNNIIGGTSAGDRNVISGNTASGISLTTGATGDQVLGNYIGTDASGSSPLPNNSQNGVYLAGATNDTIGGTGAGAKNVISGNLTGIDLASGTTGILVLGNDIGTDPSGLESVPNAYGVEISGTARNTIGGGTGGAGNLISGNTFWGIFLTAGAFDNQVLGNLIGTNASGTNALPNGGDGVLVSSSLGNTIGGTAAADRNIISGNGGSGIDLVSNSSGNLVLGNFIGTDISGENPLGNSDGITINAASGNTIGGAAPVATNVISGNTSIAVQISNSAASGNSVLGNLIGTNKGGNRVVLTPSNLDSGFPVGVLINDSPGNSIGGTATGEGNVISGFGVAVNISGFNASGNAILGDLIGTDRNGNVLDGKTGVGVYINGAGGCSVGGTTPSARNVIQGYSTYGVLIFGSLAKDNVVQGNQIGLTTRIKTGRLAGVAIESASSNTVRGNTISGNRQAAVYIFGQNNSAVDNVIAGNQLVRNLYGILLYNAANNELIYEAQERQ